MILLYIILSSIILYWAAIYLKISSKSEFKKHFLLAIKTILSYGVFTYIMSSASHIGAILGIFFLPYFIKYFYKIDIKKAIKLWFFYLLFLFPVLLTVALIISIPDILDVYQTQYKDTSAKEPSPEQMHQLLEWLKQDSATLQ